jgi:hypothetical protein
LMLLVAEVNTIPDTVASSTNNKLMLANPLFIYIFPIPFASVKIAYVSYS